VPYAVIILSGRKEIKRLNERSLSSAYTVFDHHVEQLSWSKAFRDGIGVKQSQEVTVQLFDKREGFELREEIV